MDRQIFLWDFDDLQTSSNRDTAHLYAGNGVYNVKLIAVNNVGCSDSITKQVEVFQEPDAGFTSLDFCINSQVSFTDTLYTSYK